MRIARLDLLRYGKFTDRSLALPRAARDFHLIVGPNEAGKSTLRSAILDLLFGIETRSRFNFLHAHGDMRLGALIEHADKNLDFVRIKARSRTLQTPAGTTLPDNALAPFLGSVDRAFFDQMFGLDHARLVTGGREILNASNDVGQILFQSAAGIGSLGAVRDALESEANSLWAPRSGKEREYYLASNELEKADAALKLATVRTKDWVSARAEVERLAAEIEASRQQYRILEQERVRLDRVRRVAPLLTTLKEREHALAALGTVIALPAEAAGQLARAELEIAKASQARKVFDEQVEELAARLSEIHPDVAVLHRLADIQALDEQRQQLRNHPSDISKRQEEVRAHLQAIARLAHELGWPMEEEGSLQRRIPSPLVRAAIGALIRRHDLTAQAVAATLELQAGKQSEIRAIDKELQALPTTEIAPTLHDALATARALGDIAAQERRLAAQVTRAERELATAALQLAPWNLDIGALRQLQLPPQDEMGALQRRQAELETAAATLAERIAELQSTLKALALEISQYQAAHHPVSLGELTRMREQRDEIWQRIKSGTVELPVAAPDFEARVADADSLSDHRHDKAQEASELQAKLDQQERLLQQLADLRTRLQENAESQASFSAAWQARMATTGLAGMPLAQLSAWRAARDQTLHAAEALTEARQALQEFRELAAAAQSALKNELRTAHAVDSLTLSALVLHAGETIDAASRAQERRTTLAAQKTRARIALDDIAHKLSLAETALAGWRSEWNKHLKAAHLAVDADTSASVVATEVALTLFERIDDHLRQIRELRTARIDAMQRDLDDFAGKATELAQAIAPELRAPAADLVAHALAQRAAEASAADKERHRLQQELEQTSKQLASAVTRIQAAQAELSPLIHLAAVLNNDELRIAIERSDRARSLQSGIDAGLHALNEAGDGLSREILEKECAATDLAQIPGELSELKSRVDEILERQTRFAGELNAAQEALARIAGQDEAARAEAQRQEALARMANAAERYIKVYTAARLLRWAIERYRETKQGPMLSRAGDIFAALTLGSFTRLVVDYDSEPLTLFGQRVSGEHVAIEGMSDGARDQLYLALRLAALELHLQQAPAMPFIADDLFINYDDTRAKAGLEALVGLSEMTQVILLTHHDHLVPVAESVFGASLNVVRLG